METNKNNKRVWLGAMFSFALVAIMGLTFAFKAGDKTGIKDPEPYYFFKYSAAPGNEGDKSFWTNVSSEEPACNGENDGCLIKVDAGYVEEIDSQIVLTEDIPVSTTGAHRNPVVGDMVLEAFNRNL